MVPPPLKNHKIAGGTRWHTHNTEIGEETVCTSEYVGEETALHPGRSITPMLLERPTVKAKKIASKKGLTKKFCVQKGVNFESLCSNSDVIWT